MIVSFIWSCLRGKVNKPLGYFVSALWSFFLKGYLKADPQEVLLDIKYAKAAWQSLLALN